MAGDANGSGCMYCDAGLEPKPWVDGRLMHPVRITWGTTSMEYQDTIATCTRAAHEKGETR